MKLKALIIILFFYYSGNSQTYLELNTEWEEYSISCGGGNPYCTSKEYSIQLTGDTTINNEVYFKTKREGIITTWDWTVDTLVSETELNDYLFPIREEQGVFYIFYTSQNEEQILHDFNLSVGDTAVSASPCFEAQIVRQIDTVYFGSQMRKKFIFRPDLTSATSPLYEGIGTSRGLFIKPCSGQIAIEAGSSLYCYSHMDETLQVDTLGSCETTAITVSTETLILDEISVRPNPFEDQLIIENTFSASSHTVIRLYDFNGKLVKAYSTLDTDNNFVISTMDLVAGIYFLIINSNGEIRNSKLVKI